MTTLDDRDDESRDKILADAEDMDADERADKLARLTDEEREHIDEDTGLGTENNPVSLQPASVPVVAPVPKAFTQKRNIKFLERAEIEKIIRWAKKLPLRSFPRDKWRSLRDVALMETLFSTGLRISEALALDREDIKRIKETGELTIIGKGGYQRVIYFSPSAIKALRAWQAFRVADDNDWRVFPMKVRSAQAMVSQRADDAGFAGRGVTPHIFRHSLATDLLSQGVDVRHVQAFLGHRAITSTLVYCHVKSGALKAIHDKLYS
jgi:site-specific recombinase XerD